MDILLLQLDHGVYGVRRDDVPEIRLAPALFRPPLTPKEMAGVVSLDGKTRVLGDLSACLGFSPLDRKDGLTLLVLDTESELPGFVVSEVLKTITVHGDDIHPLSVELESSLCTSWLSWESNLVPLLELPTLQYQLLAGSDPSETFSSTVAFPEFQDPETRFWSVSIHGKPFAVATQMIRPSADPSALAPLFSLPDFIPALLLDDDQALPACDLAGLLFDAPLENGQLVVSDDGSRKIACWVDREPLCQVLRGTPVPLPHLVARKGLDRALLHGGEIYPLVDPVTLCRIGRTWHDVPLQRDMPMSRNVPSWESVVEISLNGARYAVPRSVVTRELPVQKIVPLPAAPAIVCGLTLHEGELLPVLDFTPYFGRRSEPKASSRLLWIQDRGITFMLLVEEVLSGRPLAEETRRQLPFQLKESLVCGCYVDDRDVLLVLDPVAMAYGFREEIVRDFRRQLVASGLAESQTLSEDGDWWEILESVVPDVIESEPAEAALPGDVEPELEELPSEVPEPPAGIPTGEDEAAAESGLSRQEPPSMRDDEAVTEEDLGPEADPHLGEPLLDEAAPGSVPSPPFQVFAAGGGGLSAEDTDTVRADLEETLAEMSPELEEGSDASTSEGERAVTSVGPEDGRDRGASEGRSAAVDEAVREPLDPAGTAGLPDVSWQGGGPEPEWTPPQSLGDPPQEVRDTASVVDAESAPGASSQTIDDAKNVEAEPPPTEGETSDAFSSEAQDLDGEDLAAGVPSVEGPTGVTGWAVNEETGDASMVDEPSDLVAASDPESEKLFAAAFEEDAAAAVRDDVDTLSTPPSRPVEEPQDAPVIEIPSGQRRHNVWSHASADAPEHRPEPHVQHDVKVRPRKARRPRQLDLIVVVLLLGLGWWFFAYPTAPPELPEPAEPVAPAVALPARTAPLPPATEETGVAAEPVTPAVPVPARTAPRPPATGETGVVAEPRIPVEAGDADREQADQDQLTIVIPADLLKETYSHQDLVVTIRWGDTLWDLSERYTGNPWNYRRIAKENNIRDPDLIFPRQKLNIRKK